MQTASPTTELSACSSSVAFGNAHKFTGKERDSETGLDNFGARYDASSLGRFMTPDPLMASAHASNPQTWNRYSYALNNPTRLVDPDGMEVAQSCIKDLNCRITIRLNVIWDKQMNNGKGPTEKQKQTFQKEQLREAEKRYGTANVSLNVSYTEGSWRQEGNKVYVSGARSDSLNIVASDSVPGGGAGASFVGTAEGKKTAFSIVNMNEAVTLDVPFLQAPTLPHEMAHHMLDDVLLPPPNFLQYFGREFSADSYAAGAGGFSAERVSYREAVGTKSYAVQLANPEANKPSN